MISDQDEIAAAPKRPRMAVPPEAPPGIEQDEKGNLIPFEKRTCDDQQRARTGQKD